MGTMFLKKITTGTIGLTVETCESAAKGHKTDSVPVAQVYGFITGQETGTSTYGSFIRFRGEFEAKNLLSAQTYRSGALILPAVGEGPLAGEFNGAEGGRLKFGMLISVQENASQAKGTKFKWVASPLIEPSQDDELSKLAKALPSPVKGKNGK